MGNCKLVHQPPEVSELQTQTQPIITRDQQQAVRVQVPPPSSPPQNQSNTSQSNRMIFNHHAKEHSVQQRDLANNSSQLPNQTNEDIVPAHLKQPSDDQVSQAMSEQFSPNQMVLEPSNDQEHQNQPPSYQENQYIDDSQPPEMNLTDFKKEIELEVHQLQANPPQRRLDLPPFNYGDEPQYPLEYRIEMRPAYRMPDGSTYVGEWNGQTLYGKGVMEGENGKYEGYWIDGRKNGRGRYTYPEGDVYEGDWLNDRATGMGTYYYASGVVYNGQWRDDQRNGVGKEIFVNGASYEGDFLNDQKTGKGVFIWRDGTRFEGDFLNNKINGHGIMQYSNGRRYEGDYLDGLMHGMGQFSVKMLAIYDFQWPDKRVYVGEYQKDRKHGQGKLTYPDGRFYEGQWKQGQMDGQGVITVAQHQRKGVWSQGNRVKWID